MNDDSRVIGKSSHTLPEYKAGDVDDAVTVSISTTPGEWLVNTMDAVVVPMSMAELVEALRARRLTERSLVWRAGMQEWAPVDKVPQLKLAARLPSPLPAPSMAPASATPRPTNTTKPPPKPARASSPSNALPAHALPSRRATLPFGLPVAPAAPHARPTPRVALPPPASQEDTDVLAVYARPAATISFELTGEVESRTAGQQEAVPQTLAPTTTDSARNHSPRPSQRDLSVVAASQFRQAQSSSKRLVWISSLASAAAASLLTFWLSGGKTPENAGSRPAPLTEARPPAPPLSAAPVAPAPLPEAKPLAEAVPSAAPSAKPKPRPKARWGAPRPPRVKVEPPAAAVAEPPTVEPNPYDVNLDEQAPAKSPTSPGSGSEPASSPESAASSSSPGF